MCYEKLLSKYDKNKCILHMHGGEMVGTTELERVYQRFIALNNYMKNNFCKNGIISKDRVDVLYNGIDLKQFFTELSMEEKKAIKEKYGLKDDDIILLFCGRLIPEKGVRELILALKQLDNIEKIKLVIIGNSAFGKNEKNKYQEELFEISKEITNNIVFTGFIHNKELYKIYNIADIAITPSMWEDASPLVIVEEMASALPIITTDSGGIPELVNFDSSIIVKRDENIVENIARNIELLIADERRREIMGIERKKSQLTVFCRELL